MLRMLYASDWIEIAPRGLRSITTRWSYPLASTALRAACNVTSAHALCSFLLFGRPPALFLPDDDLPVIGIAAATTAASARQQLPPVLALFADASLRACAHNGDGRRLVLDGPPYYYTITACDIIEGGLVVRFAPMQQQLYVLPQTFGPVAYCIMLSLAAACLYHMTNPPASSALMMMVSLLAVTCCVLVWLLHDIPFGAQADALHFGLMCLACLLRPHTQEACLYALAAFVDAVYRTAENPYALLLCAVLAVRLWQLLLAPHPSKRLDLTLTAAALCLTLEVGIVPQLAHDHTWPMVLGTSAFVAYAVARALDTDP
jgi:hypothetical protein